MYIKKQTGNERQRGSERESAQRRRGKKGHDVCLHLTLFFNKSPGNKVLVEAQSDLINYSESLF